LCTRRPETRPASREAEESARAREEEDEAFVGDPLDDGAAGARCGACEERAREERVGKEGAQERRGEDRGGGKAAEVDVDAHGIRVARRRVPQALHHEASRRGREERADGDREERGEGRRRRDVGQDLG